MNRGYLAIAMYYMLAGCVAVSAAAGLPSGDMKNWQTYSVELENRVVQFSIPRGESSDYPEFRVPKSVAFRQPGLYSLENLGPSILRRFWDYRSSRFGPFFGTLRAIIQLHCSSKVLNSTDDVVFAIQENVRLREEAQGVQENSFRNRVLNSKEVTIAGTTALLVEFSISSPTYFIVLDASHYISIVVDSSEVMPPWHEQAQSAGEAILNSIRIKQNGRSAMNKATSPSGY